MLKAVQPQKLASTLTAIATALDGRGERLGEAMADTADYLEDFNPERAPSSPPTSATWPRSASSTATSRPTCSTRSPTPRSTLNTVADERVRLTDLYAQVTGSAQDVTIFLRNNKENIIALAAHGRAPLELAARYSPSLPVHAQGADRPQARDGQGARRRDEPARPAHRRDRHALARRVPARRRRPGVRRDRRPALLPERRGAATVGAVAAATGSTGHPLLPGSGGDLGLANSPQEQELVASIAGPAAGFAPGEVPAWSSVLVGPLYRGTEVTLR